MRPRIQGTPKILDKGARSFSESAVIIQGSPEFQRFLKEVDRAIANGYSCYRREKVERRAGSHIEGRGLFATANIDEGELIAVKAGRVVNEALVRQMTRESILHGSQQQIGRDEFLIGLDENEEDENLVGYNHSCDPNAYVHIDGSKQLAYVLARRDIAPGEEITTDYSVSHMSNTHRLLCRCGSPLCRGIVQPHYDFIKPGLQERYRGEFPEYIQYVIGAITALSEEERKQHLLAIEFGETAGKIVVLSDEIEKQRTGQSSLEPRNFFLRALGRTKKAEGFQIQKTDDPELVEGLLAWCARYMTSYPMRPRVELDERTPETLKSSIKDRIGQIVFCAQMHDEAAGWEHEFPVNVRLIQE